jgi:nitrogen regulatory protein P-II 1
LTCACFPGQLVTAREFSFQESDGPFHLDAAATGQGVGADEYLMKLIIALIQPTKLEAVKEALSQVEVFRLTVMDVQGFGRQKGYTEVYRGHEFTVNLLRKIELQIAVNEDFVEPTVNAIIQAGRSGPDGKIGDGKIFILPMDDCIRIRTGERGPEAI